MLQIAARGTLVPCAPRTGPAMTVSASAAPGKAHYLSPALKDKELTDLLLLVDVILFQQLFVQPVGVSDAWHWVLYLREGET